MRTLSLALVLLSAAIPAPDPAVAQQADTLPPVENTAVFETLALPTPNAVRMASGEPGPRYWQQRADYDIEVRLDPEDHRITGRETITYTNNSPAELEYLWVQLDQNLFDPESTGARITPPDERFSGAFEGGGYEISEVTISAEDGEYEPEYLIEGTRMRIALEEPLPAGGGRLELSLAFAFTVPEYGADRMGRLEVDDGTVYELAQWYPRVYTFDDVNGWNTLPYLGQGEWYLEYGDFRVRITAPREHIVVATGELQNPGEVLTGEQRERLERARGSAETVPVLARDEVGAEDSRPEGDGPLTWEFRAEDVRDFSWAASEAFIWDAAGWDDVLVMSVYPEEGIGTREQPGWERSTEFVRHSIRHYSEMWHPYPYPVAINVAGIVGGMEYPMIVFCSVEARGVALFAVTDHEFGHEWFPMLVGSDERRHAWMDEGLNTFMNFYSIRDFFGPELVGEVNMGAERIAGLMQSPLGNQPIVTDADRLRSAGLGFLGYRKPGAGLRILREYILGAERFDPAFSEFIDRWRHRHPQPADFFRTIENVAGEDLDWFWTGWFFSTDVLDHAIAGVESRGDTLLVHLENREGLVMPLEMEVSYADGTSDRRRVPVQAWYTSDDFTEVLVTEDEVRGIRLDPDGLLPDVDRSNDVWRAGQGGSAPSTSSADDGISAIPCAVCRAGFPAPATLLSSGPPEEADRCCGPDARTSGARTSDHADTAPERHRRP